MNRLFNRPGRPRQSQEEGIRRVMAKVDPQVARVFLPWALHNPRYLRTFIKLRKTHATGIKARNAANEQGVKVPPFMILSITSKCNLACNGCYASAAGHLSNGAEARGHLMNWDQWHSVIQQASELGVFGFVIAGGEPFMYPGLIELCMAFPDRLFVIITNGTHIADYEFKLLKKVSNLAVLVSLEGSEEHTDARRGVGVHTKASQTLQRLNKAGVLTGVSTTITRENYRYWMDEKRIDALLGKGIRIGAFIEYIPVEPQELAPRQSGVEDAAEPDAEDKLMLTQDERAEFREFMLWARESKPIYLIHSPGDEEYFGGCVSAGRGFAHITPSGDLTPCPVSNIATHNLKDASLMDALASPLFKEIRESEHLLETEGVPCALFAHPEEVDALARGVGAYRTNITQETAI
jgi:MoaA/NifB/PqqE/SkfB family radical SAM enzyme